MKNKNNNRTSNELTDLILEIQRLSGNRDSAYAYVTGSLISIIEGNRNHGDNIQNMINNLYEDYAEELEVLKAKKMDELQKVANSASLEELYA